jgi:hypothetical protein
MRMERVALNARTLCDHAETRERRALLRRCLSTLILEALMETKISEIADGIYRLSAYVPDIALPAGFTFNQFLVVGDEPLMFHTGLRRMFPLCCPVRAYG